MRQRPATELLLGAKIATEFRSLVLPNTLSEIQKLLEFAKRFRGVVRDIQTLKTENADFSIWQHLVKTLETA